MVPKLRIAHFGHLYTAHLEVTSKEGLSDSALNNSYLQANRKTLK